ncbi:hypothetical protein [Burkholderia ubonensis]|uniref:hypothetical protein n=1 Tax=Burkholderia ubonensis TaxID=101571 RepID=UPI001583A1E9|nr:hypothetical protein [Burkholderia ubonensis]
MKENAIAGSGDRQAAYIEPILDTQAGRKIRDLRRNVVRQLPLRWIVNNRRQAGVDAPKRASTPCESDSSHPSRLPPIPVDCLQNKSERPEQFQKKSTATGSNYLNKSRLKIHHPGKVRLIFHRRHQ